MEETREALEFDVLFVGGGPANLAGAIHLMNLAQQAGREGMRVAAALPVQVFIDMAGAAGFRCRGRRRLFGYWRVPVSRRYLARFGVA